MKQSYSIDTIPSILGKLGTNSIQNYILTLGRELYSFSSSLDGELYHSYEDIEKTHFKEVLNYGSSVLQYLMDKNIVVKQTKTTTSDRKVIEIVPNIPIPTLIEKTKSVYPIRTVESSKLKKDEILHSVNIAKLNKSCLDLLVYQNNIPLLVRNRNLSRSKRVPKNESSIGEPNYILETELIKSYIKDYDEQIIFMNHSYDRRGRLYSTNYPLSFQSDEYTRSCFELAFKQPINENGLVWLKRDIANLAGLDKHTYARKEEWFDSAKYDIIEVGRTGRIDPKNETFQSLDKPIRFISACRAFVDYIENKPSGYLTSIDSTASGSQIMALLTRDELAAKYTNITNDKNRWDIYSEVAREFYKLKKDPNKFTYLTDRKRFKQAVMISGYNGKTAVENNFPDPKDRELFYEAMHTICKGAKELTELINQAYLDNSDKTYMSWIMPDGFQVCIPQFKAKWHRIINKDFECMFKYDAIECDVKTNKRSLCPNFLHSSDSFICRELLRRCISKDIEIMSVHDSFYSHPNNMSIILDTYNDILQDINTLKYDLVGSFLTDIYGKKMSNPYSSRKSLDDIRYARYSLC